LVEEPRLLAEQLGFLNAFDFGPDGYLYGPLYIRGQFVRIDVNAEPVAIETVGEGFILPAAAKFDAQGRLHVLDQATGEVALLNPETGEKSVLATLPPGIDNLAFDAQGRLFVTHNSQAYVFEVMADGTVRTVSPGGMTGPGGVAILTQNGVDTIYIGNVMAINAFDAQTGEPGLYYEANAVTVAPDGENLLLSSWFANSVEIWNPATGKSVAAYRDFAVPVNAIRFQGDLIVAELGTASVLRVDGADPESGAKRLSSIDLETGEVIIVAENLALGIAAWPGMPPTHLLNGVTVDAAGTIYVTGDIENVLYRITPAQ
jgi:sugar lactone lactonase YvrE